MSKIEEEYSKRFKGQEWSEGVDAAGIWAAVEQNLTPPKKKFRAIWVLLPLMFVLGGASMWVTMKTKEGAIFSPYGEHLDMKSGSYSNPSTQNNLGDASNIGSDLESQQKTQTLQSNTTLVKSAVSAIEGSNLEGEKGTNGIQNDTKVESLSSSQPKNKARTIKKNKALAPLLNEVNVGSDGKGTDIENSFNDSSGLVDQASNRGSAQQDLQNGNFFIIPGRENQSALWSLIRMERKPLMPRFQTSYQEIVKSPSSFEYAKDRRWELSSEAGRNVSFLKFKDSPQKTRYQATNGSAFGTCVLINFTYLTKSNWRISTGLGWSQWTTKFKERTVSSAEFEVNGVIGFSGDTIAGYTPIYGPVMVKGTEIRNIKHNNKVKNITIPLTMGKELHKRRYTFGWNAGLAYHFVLHQGGRGIDIEGVDAFYGEKNRRAFNRNLWSANLDLFYDYALTEQWSLRLRPNLTYIGNQSGSFFQGDVDLWSYGLRIGVTRDW